MGIKLKYSVVGFLMGVAELIPGVSGSTIAVIFGIYKNLMSILSEIKPSNLSLSLKELGDKLQIFLAIPLLLSMTLSIALCAKVISYLIDSHAGIFFTILGWIMITLSFFVADFFRPILRQFSLIAFIILGICFGAFINGLDISSVTPSSYYLFLSGILAFSFFLVPGISGSAMLVILGVYEVVVGGVSSFNFEILLPFAMGCLFSALLLPRLILKIYSSYESQLTLTFSGLIFSSGYFLI